MTPTGGDGGQLLHVITELRKTLDAVDPALEGHRLRFDSRREIFGRLADHSSSAALAEAAHSLRQGRGAVDDASRAIRLVIHDLINSMTMLRHDHAGTPQVYPRPGIQQEHERRPRRYDAHGDDGRQLFEPALHEGPVPKRQERLLIHMGGAAYLDVAAWPLWTAAEPMVSLAPAGPRGDEALGVALSALARHHPSELRAMVEFAERAPEDPAGVSVTFPVRPPVLLTARLPYTYAANPHFSYERQDVVLYELAGLRGDDGSTGIGFLAKAYAAVGEDTGFDATTLDLRIANAMTCLTGRYTAWDQLGDMVDDASLRDHLDRPLAIVISDDIDAGHRAEATASRHGLVIGRRQAYLVEGVDDHGDVRLHNPFGVQPRPISPADLRMCFETSVVGQAPAATEPESDPHGLGSIT